MEKSGEKAGQRAGRAASKAMQEEVAKGSKDSSVIFERDFKNAVGEVNKAISEIDVNRLPNSVRKAFSEVKKEAQDLAKTDVFNEKSLRRAEAAFAGILGDLQHIRDNSNIALRDNFDDVLKRGQKIVGVLDRIKEPHELEVRSGSLDQLERKVGSFERTLRKAFTDAAKHIGDTVDPALIKVRNRLEELSKMDVLPKDAHRELRALANEADKIGRKSVHIDTKVDAGRTFATLAAVSAALKKTQSDGERTKRSLFGLKRTGDDISNSFRSFSAVLLGVVGIGPALIPVLAGIAGALIALGPAAGVAVASLGSVLVGFSGIGAALGALQAQQDQAAMTAQTAARSEASSARAVARARQSAAKQVESALERQREAQKRYAASIQDVKDAEQALREAREEAKNDGADLDRKVRENKLAIDQALLNSFDATVTFNAVQADGSATNAEKEQARINMEEAKLALEELRAEQKELAAEKAKWDREGVNGTEKVKTAQDNLNDAIEAQKEAYKDLGDAAKDVDEARRDGAQSVADAIEAQSQAMESLNSQQNKVNQAFAKLGPAGQAFALFLFGLRNEFYKFRDDVQAVLLPSVQAAIDGFMKSAAGSTARGALIGLADGFGKVVLALSQSFQGPAWSGFFQMLADLGPQIQAAYGGAFIKFLEAMASLMTTAAPFALRFAEGLEKMMTAFANWAASEKGQKQLGDFLGYVERIGPKVLDFFGSFATAAADIGKALAPWGEIVLDGVINFLDMISNMDPTVLSGIVTALVGMLVASQVAFGIQALVTSLSALVTGAIGPVVLILAGLALAFVYLYKTNEDFRDFVQDAWDRISKAVSKAWDEYLKPALTELWEAMQQLWDEVLQPFFEWLGPIIVRFIEWYLPVLMRQWSLMAHAIAWAIREVVIPVILWLADTFVWLWKNVLKPVWGAISVAARWLWKNVLQPVFQDIGDLWDDLMRGMGWVWDNILRPVFRFIEKQALPALQTAFETVVDAIGTVWDTLQGIFATPIVFIVDTVLNDGLFAGINRVLDWVGNDNRLHINLPKGVRNAAFATGGIMPGYTPGRDVHDFYSPTGGRLALSGGEAIMRPEWTAAVGRGFVDFMNAAARSGGVKGVRQAFSSYFGGDQGVNAAGQAQAFAKGGVVGLKQVDINRALQFVKDHDSAPYGWGSAGPSSFDCSGLIAAATNVIRNVGNVYQRLGNTATMPWSGFKKGQGQFTVGNADNYGGSGVGHMAGTLGGVNIESRGGEGVVWGPRARGYNDPGFNEHYYLGAGVGSTLADGSKVVKGGGSGWPKWILNVAKNPVGYVKDLIQGPVDKFKSKFGDSSMIANLAKMPGRLPQMVGDKIVSILPDALVSAAGAVARGAGKVVDVAGDAGTAVVHGVGSGIDAVGDALGFADGGILPYNGTMMYDNGGYLPPGLTSVVNLTGKPEPVFTADQWSNMEGGAGAGTIHYEPHFEGSDLTAADVAADMNFQFRRIRRGGKYAGVGNP